VAQEEQMNQTPNAEPGSPIDRLRRDERPTLNVELSAGPTRSNIKRQRSYILWRILDFILAGVFIFAGLSKMFDLDHLVADLMNLRFGDAWIQFQQLSVASPTEFASGIDNFKLVPWPVSVALAFYLPWLEIFCALGLLFRLLYRGALTLLIILMAVFTFAITAAKVRGLDITCGCFGHASQHWSFPSHLATNLTILAALLALSFSIRSRKHL
jgi:uncharacterized membrane protein YphA (DoxX/SURF4 family)